MCLATAPSAFADSRSDDPAFSLDSSSECKFGGKNIASTPWSLQRIIMDQLKDKATGKGVTVAVIDTGVDDDNKQLAGQMASKGKDFVGGRADGTQDLQGHGTKVAGIIAAKKVPNSGFMGLAPDAKILPIRYTGAAGKNGKVKNGNSDTMVAAINYAVEQRVQIINISSDTQGRRDPEALRIAIQEAVDAGIIVVAAAGNAGVDGLSKKTYPASYDGVVAVAASDRNDERAFFSQAGDFVDIAAPGVDMVSTVPKGGQCTDQGTSFAAPYVAGVAALMKDRYPEWNSKQIIARMQETAQRPTAEPNRYVGWGVVDPLAALSNSTEPGETPKPEAPQQAGSGQVTPMRVTMGETPAERDRRIAIYVLGAGLLLVFVAGGSGIAVRDWRRKKAGGLGTD
ncbi:type VII secretion-associated serine protease mycosin [Streptomyces cavernicola]|uniref:Type VII secretion-associated serine protease mycosin n=1 Tax=Streptomyces cavernicola TaxID=3043613 RepID=A0ABT6SHR2_9ACTN|nr:type VII secretion-associated serine protease mycosin [Streptomyces sp. B-S-A6]MDI3407197.1 type VII secretion-associated serine protease mycosin [Streptomyces sp. B-S-A6]